MGLLQKSSPNSRARMTLNEKEDGEGIHERRKELTAKDGTDLCRTRAL